MPPEVHAREDSQQLQFADIADQARVEQTIVHLCPGSDPHSSAVDWRVREDGGNHRTLAVCGRFSAWSLWDGEFQCKRPEPCERCRQTQRVSTMPAQPARKFVGETRDLAIEAHTRRARVI